MFPGSSVLRVFTALLSLAGASAAFAQVTFASRVDFQAAFNSRQALKLSGRIPSQFSENWTYGGGSGHSEFGAITLPQEKFSFSGNTYGTLTETYLIDRASWQLNGASMILGGRFSLDVALPPHTRAFAADVGLSPADVGNRALVVSVQLSQSGWKSLGSLPTPDGSSRFLGVASAESILAVRLSTSFTGLGGFVAINNIETSGMLTIKLGTESMEPNLLRTNIIGSLLTKPYKRPGSSQWASQWASMTNVVLTGYPGQRVKMFISTTKSDGGHKVHTGARPHGWLTRIDGTKPTIGPTSSPGTTAYSNVTTAVSEIGNADGSSPIPIILDAAGRFELAYWPSELGGIETINVLDLADATLNAKAPISLSFSGLASLSAGENAPWELYDSGSGGRNTHDWSDAYWGTPELIAAIKILARNYVASKAGPNAKLKVNDMSLPKGGMFDLDAAWSQQSGHIGHKLGLEVDISEKLSNLEFGELVTDQGFWIENRTLWIKEKTHYHLNLAGDTGKGKISLYGEKALATWDGAKFVAIIPVLNRGGLDAKEATVSKIDVLGASPETTVQIKSFKKLLGSIPLASRRSMTINFNSNKPSGWIDLVFTYSSVAANGTPFGDQTTRKTFRVEFNKG